MYYFVGLNIGKKLPGIEHSQIKRLKLFHQYHYPAKIITMNYSTELYRNAKNHGVSQDVISMYDFFQQSVGDYQYGGLDFYNMWKQDENMTIEHVEADNDLKLFYRDDYICYAHFYDSEYKHIDYINYFDAPYGSRRKVKREVYDLRGFLSSVKILGNNQETLYDSYYSPSGQEKITIYRTLKGDISRVILHDYKGQTFYFQTLADWQAFFLDELNEEGSIFFSDRSRFLIPALNKMKTEKIAVPIFHSIHLRQPDDPVHSEIRLPYQEAFRYMEHLDGFVVSTKKQKDDIDVRIRDKLIVRDIPVGVTPNNMKRVPYQKRNPYKIISVARYSEEKQLEHQLLTIKKLASEFPEIELHLFGYGDAATQFKEEKQLRQFVKENGLEDYVFFRGYQPSLKEEYETASLLLLTSKIEGFCLALLEAAQYGVPSIAYDIRYGPDTIVEDGFNGYLIAPNNVNGLIEKTRMLLNDTEKRVRMSNNAYVKAQEFSEKHVMMRWQKLIEDIQKTD